MVDTADKAKEPKSKVQHHAQMFELMFEDVVADVQLQTVQEQSTFSG